MLISLNMMRESHLSQNKLVKVRTIIFVLLVDTSKSILTIEPNILLFREISGTL